MNPYRYIEYSKIEDVLTFWSWVYYDWWFIGRSETSSRLVRKDGFRVLGFKFEREWELPPGRVF